MPSYTFRVLEGCDHVEDESGIDFQCRDHATRYARDIVLELMKNREVQTRCWRLDVYEDDHGPICTIPFARIDPTLDHLKPELRARVEALCDRRRSFNEMRHAVNATLQESRALVARSRGKPYLASQFGRSIIRN